MCYSSLDSAVITDPNDKSDLLIDFPSLNLSKVLSALETLSDPAKSTRLNFPTVLELVSRFVTSIKMLKIRCDLEL